MWTKLKSNCVGPQWAICTSARILVLTVADYSGWEVWDLIHVKEKRRSRRPSCMAETWTGNECNAWSENECDVWIGNECDVWIGNKCNAWSENECDAWTVNERNAWMRHIDDRWVWCMNSERVRRMNEKCMNRKKDSIVHESERKKRDVWYVHVPPC